MKSLLAERLRAARKSMYPEVSQRDVAKTVERSPSAVNLWEAGKTEPGASELVAMARLYKRSTDWLLGLDDSAPGGGEAVSINAVPILTPAQAAAWEWDAPKALLQTERAYTPQSAAALPVTNDALASVCPVGAHVVICRAETPLPGDVIAVVLPDGTEPVLRRYVKEGGSTMLVADDTRFPSYVMSDRIAIVGTVTEVTIRRYIKR